MISFLGESHAAVIFRSAARVKGFQLCNPDEASIVFICEDTPTDDEGNRDLEPIRKLVLLAKDYCPNLILTSQVPPGFTRSLGVPIYHQSETLRIKDALDRALNPEQLIVGCFNPNDSLPVVYMNYLKAFNCPIFKMTYEEAEFSKIAINMTLASQVENTNRLAESAQRCGARWEIIANVLSHDRRIGPFSYLEPGDWKRSKHLLRDYATLKEIDGQVPD